MMSPLPGRAVALLLVVLGFSRAALAADDLAPGKQAALLLRVLPYDRAFSRRATNTVKIAVVYRGGNLESETYAIDMATALRDLARTTAIRNLPVQVISIAYSSQEEFAAAMARQPLAALYVCPGLVDVLESITGTTRQSRILSFSGREREVRERLSVGLLRKGARPALIVNLRSSLAEGADLQPELLALSEVIR
ncbi:YfiR family protein [Hyalangium gracile]|uniref:YfiR family protein n=1 Tax=Hyalangium gracile TaxID=394092 RepID=UPI001CCAAD10|nr:YfiR family protein [Hyalangium gracile]